MNEDTLLIVGAGVLAFVLFNKQKATVPVSSVYHPTAPIYAQPVYQTQTPTGLLLPIIQKLFGPGTVTAPVAKPATPVVSTSPAPASSSSNAPDPFLGLGDDYNTASTYQPQDDLSTGFADNGGSVFEDYNT